MIAALALYLGRRAGGGVGRTCRHAFGCGKTVPRSWFWLSVVAHAHWHVAAQALCHALTVDAGDEFGFDTFFEWYAAQDQLTPDDPGANLQEVDYSLRWGYLLEPIQTAFTLGWTAYTFPRSTDDYTHEWFLKLEHNDAWAWRWLGYQGEDGILNPSFFLAHDMKAATGVWMELAISHPFEVARDLTVTPQVIGAIDCGYLQPLLGVEGSDFRYAYTQLGLEIAYDMTRLLHLPDWAGSVTIAGLLFYNCPTETLREEGLNDEFFGGMSLGWSW